MRSSLVGNSRWPTPGVIVAGDLGCIAPPYGEQLYTYTGAIGITEDDSQYKSQVVHHRCRVVSSKIRSTAALRPPAALHNVLISRALDL